MTTLIPQFDLKNGGSTPTGAVNRAINLKLAETVSVLDFGADNTGIADSATAIQNAINSTSSIYFPAGTYKVGTTLTLNSNTTIHGDGEASVISATAGTVLFYGLSSSSSTYIENVTIRNIKLLGDVVVSGFSEYVHLIAVNGVRNFKLENSFLAGFQGDGLYIGAHTDNTRHNINVKVTNCTFDGINNQNRNGISVVDGVNVLINGNTFVNTTKSTMPASIDIETNAITNVIQGITITNNYFSNCLGSYGPVLLANSQLLTVQPYNFIISNNTFNVDASNFAVSVRFDQNYSYSENIVISNNNVYGILFNVYPYINGATITGNSIEGYLGNLGGGGSPSTNYITNVIIANNNCTGHSDAKCLSVTIGAYITIVNNIFISYLDYAIVVGNASAGTLSSLKIDGNTFNNISGAAKSVYSLGNVSGASCSYLNNIDSLLTTNYPAWKTSNSVANNSTATSFNSATLPQSFPVGICTAWINGDTGVPSTGGYQGTLTNTYVSYTSSKYIYQTYYPANNTTNLGTFYLRKADVSANSWTAWYAVTGI